MLIKPWLYIGTSSNQFWPIRLRKCHPSCHLSTLSIFPPCCSCPFCYPRLHQAVLRPNLTSHLCKLFSLGSRPWHSQTEKYPQFSLEIFGPNFYTPSSEIWTPISPTILHPIISFPSVALDLVF